MRLAIPKGRLQEPALALLRAAGFPLGVAGARAYRLTAPDDIEARLFKPRSIPELIDIGAIDVGLTGRDVVVDAEVTHAVCHLDLGLNRVRIVVATPAAKAGILAAPPPRPLVVATEYPNVAERWMMDRGLAHVVLRSHGTTEAYLPDVADVIIDCVETGATLAANGLVGVEELFESTTWVVVHRDVLARPTPTVTRFLDGLRAHLAAAAPPC
jgi:ATP phosphoribosyltransferase